MRGFGPCRVLICDYAARRFLPSRRRWAASGRIRQFSPTPPPLPLPWADRHANRNPTACLRVLMSTEICCAVPAVRPEPAAIFGSALVARHYGGPDAAGRHPTALPRAPYPAPRATVTTRPNIGKG